MGSKLFIMVLQLKEINKKINELKRAGWKPKPDTIVMKLNEKPVTYRMLKKAIRKYGTT